MSYQRHITPVYAPRILSGQDFGNNVLQHSHGDNSI